MELFIAVLCAKILGALTVVGFGLLLLVGAVNCRAEDEYWNRSWAETPVACLGTDGSEESEIIDFPLELRLAA